MIGEIVCLQGLLPLPYERALQWSHKWWLNATFFRDIRIPKHTLSPSSLSFRPHLILPLSLHLSPYPWKETAVAGVGGNWGVPRAWVRVSLIGRRPIFCCAHRTIELSRAVSRGSKEPRDIPPFGVTATVIFFIRLLFLYIHFQGRDFLCRM